MSNNLKLFSNFTGGNTRMVVCSKAKFERYIEQGVTDARLTLIQKMKTISKPVIGLRSYKKRATLELKEETKTSKGKMTNIVRKLNRKDEFKQLTLDNWNFIINGHKDKHLC